MNYILFDDASRDSLKPLSYTRPVCDMRVGIMTIREKWEKYLGEETSTLTENYLSEKFPIKLSDSMILINGSICPTLDLVDQVKKLSLNQVLVYNDENDDYHIIAMYKTKDDFISDGDESEKIEYKSDFTRIVNSWDIFVNNDKELRLDYEILTNERSSEKINETNKLINPEQIFVEEGAIINCASLNASEGPIYIGKGAEIMEGSVIRGPFAMCEHSVLKLGTKIYGATTLGPHAKVAGELANVVIFGYSNKAHDGYIGSSVIGEWVNIGADSNASNLKNTYEEVRLWSIDKNTFIPTGQVFCGTIFGDHTKCGINTMFNTGTVLGVSCNVFGHGYQRNFIPSFAWGGNAGLRSYELYKAIEVARRMMARRGIELSKADERILRHIYNATLDKKVLR